MASAGDTGAKPSNPYPGSEATVGQLLGLADEYFKAAYGLLSQVSRIDPRTSSAPARLCAIHAVECYLNAFLMFHGMSREEVRGLQHNLASRHESGESVRLLRTYPELRLV